MTMRRRAATWGCRDLPREAAELDELDDLLVLCNGISHNL